MARPKIVAVPGRRSVPDGVEVQRVDLTDFYAGLNRLRECYMEARFDEAIGLMEDLVGILKLAEKRGQIDDARGQWLNIMKQIEHRVYQDTGDIKLVMGMGDALRDHALKKRQRLISLPGSGIVVPNGTAKAKATAAEDGEADT